ncbi:unnamed protein product [Parajaminaea phylloscopi]
MTSYVGLYVNVSLSDGSAIAGTIQSIDAERNLLILRPSASAKDVNIARTRIRNISTAPESKTSSATASSSSSGLAPAPAADVPRTTSEAAGQTASSDSRKDMKAKGAGKGKNKKATLGKNRLPPPPANSSLNSSSSASVPTEDFDFEASLKTFDKARIWQEIRASDTTDPAGRLVAHNRLPTPVGSRVVEASSSSPLSGSDRRNDSPGPRGRARNGDLLSSAKQRKLRPDENVLSPSPPASPVVETPSRGQQSREVEQVHAENAVLKRRLAILEALSGFSIKANDFAAGITPQDVSFSCALLPSHGAATMQPLPPLRFDLTTTLDESDPKLRYKPAVPQDTERASTIPAKYQREMGLRLDNESARIFLQRLRDSIGEDKA